MNVAIELVRYDDVETLRLDDLVATYDPGDDGEYVRVEQAAEERPDDAPTVAVRLPVDACQQEAAKRNAFERRRAARTVEKVPRADVVEAFDALESNLRDQAENRRKMGDDDFRFDPENGDDSRYHFGEAAGLNEAALAVDEARRRFERGGRDA